MADIVDKVEQAVIAHNLLNKGDRVVIALSGGPDSVALLHLLIALRAKFDLDLAAVHLDHAIRPNSAKDREFCSQLCRNLKIKFYSKRMDIPALAKRRRLSLEEAGRKARYAYLESISSQHGYSKIATGHTFNDNIETILFNIARGCGLEGLSGIPRMRGKIIRPLLDLEKDELSSWLRSKKVKFVHDITNRSLVYSRNRIRLKVLPELEKINPAARRNIARLSEIATEELEYLSVRVVSAYEEMLLESGKGKIVLDLGKLVQYDKSLRKKVLLQAIKRSGVETGSISSQSVNRALNIVEGKSGGKAPLGKGILIEKSQGRIAIFIKSSQPGKIALHIPGITKVPAQNCFIEARIIKRDDIESLNKGMRNAYLDLNDMSDMAIRFPQKGDKIRPLGMDGHRLLSDIFIDRKIPEYERETIPLIVSGNEIAWIAGVMISDDFKITEKTQEVLNLRYACTDN